MIKVKISKVRKFAVSSEPTSFDITLKTNEYIQKGILVIDFTKKTISTDFKIPLSDESQLAVLKAIFYFNLFIGENKMNIKDKLNL